MTQRERLEKFTKPTKALAVRQKQKFHLKQKKKHTSNGSDESMPWWVWSNLPDDILREIIGKLCWSDRIRWGAVCKSMQSFVHGIEQTIDKFPWLMSYNWQTNNNGRVYSIYRLSDPSAQKSYVMKKAVKQEERKDLVHAVPCASRNGWVLFQKLNLFYFYSPFTNKIIKLPEFDYIHHIKATFTSNPTSPDCIVLIWSVGYGMGRISSWLPGDKTWTHLELHRECCHRALDVIYADEIFYCIFEDGILGAYNFVLEEWKLFADVLPVKLKGPGAATAYLIESKEDKDLLLMCAFLGHWELWRFDLSRKCWVEEERMGNRAIFLGCTSYSVPAVGRSSEFADKIYCLEDICRNKEPMCASFQDRTLWLQTELYSWMPKIGAEKLIWIQPPLQ